MRMKKYVRPVIVAADLLAEGVYLLSGESEPVALGEALNAATGADGKPENTEAADMTNGAENSIGGTEPQPEGVGTDNETGSEGTEGTDTTDTTDTADTTEVASSNETQDTDADQDTADDVVEDGGELQGSSLVTCDSKYMSGVWQAPKEGSWGGMQLGCKEVLGCKGCPADKGDGCGLQDANADSRYFRSVGALMPEWEASGKLPADSPYGI